MDYNPLTTGHSDNVEDNVLTCTDDSVMANITALSEDNGEGFVSSKMLEDHELASQQSEVVSSKFPIVQDSNANTYCADTQDYRLLEQGALTGNFLGNIDENFTTLTGQVKTLEEQLEDMKESKRKSEEQHFKMKESNMTLMKRVDLLEELIQDVECRSQEALSKEEIKRQQLMIQRSNKNSGEIEILRSSLQHLGKENEKLKEETPKLRSENDRMKRENYQLELSIVDLQAKCVSARNDRKYLMEEIKQHRLETEKERSDQTKLIDDLTHEVDELRSSNLGRLASPARSLTTVSTDSVRTDGVSSPRQDMQRQIVKLREENAILKEQEEELRAQLLSAHARENGECLVIGRDVRTRQPMVDHLPLGIKTSLSKQELIFRLQEEKHEQKFLSNYIDEIILRVLHNDPAILEAT